MKSILKKAKEQLELQLPFVLYKKPNLTTVIGVFQKNDNLFLVDDFTEKGFVFASFDGNQTVIIPQNQSEVQQEEIDENQTVFFNNTVFFTDESDQIEFEKLITKGIQAIEKEEFKKVVLSRKETVALLDFDLTATFHNLVLLYPAAFTYCFFHPKIGIWLGASPEQLIRFDGFNFSTIALAGTQKSIDFQEVEWKNKEINEQQFVTDYIVNKLEKVTENLSVSKPYSFKAGSLWHIKTDISGTLDSGYSLQKMIRLLHPTPAVCGFPKDKSKAFILENENYDRTFYTGFFGELNHSDTKNAENSDLYVNLRCMEICDSQANLYVGCGITKDSIPEKEWQESVNKSMTMKKVLDLAT